MAAAISLLAQGKHRPAWRTLMTFGLTFAIAIGPWAFIFIAHWAQVPGSHEVEQFPHPQAMRDVAPPTLPFLISNGRFLGHAIAATTWALGLMGVVVCLTKFRQDRIRLSLILIWLFFFLLALGPLFPGAPYNWVYRWNPPLRRFWWPVRHVVVSNAMWAVLAALALDYMLSRRPRALLLTAALASFLTIPILHAQGSPTSIRISAVNTPEKGYGWLASAPSGVVVSPPLAPQAGSQQLAMAFQIFHGKPLLAGHALWVDRVRPAQWDEFVSNNSFLTALQKLELGELPIHASPALATDSEVLLSFAPDDLQSLLDQDVRWFVIDRSQFTLGLQPVVKQYRLVFAELFGQSVASDEGVRFYDGTTWNRISHVVLPKWRWPETLQPGGPEMPLLGRYPNSPVFDSIGTDTQTATW